MGISSQTSNEPGAHPLHQSIQRSIEDFVLLDHPEMPALRDSNRFRVRERFDDPSRVLNWSDHVVLAADNDCWYLADDLEGVVLIQFTDGGIVVSYHLQRDICQHLG